MESKNIGKVVQIVGAVVDVRFEKDSLPDLLNAIAVSDTISSGADVAGEASSYSPSTSSR